MVSFLYLTSIDLWLTLIIFACVPVLVFVSFTLRKRTRAAFRESQAAISEIIETLEAFVII